MRIQFGIYMANKKSLNFEMKSKLHKESSHRMA